MNLQPNQSALFLTADDEGEVTVDVVSSDMNGLTGGICRAIAIKLMNDENFQAELVAMSDEDEEM
jgi:hypothetical protein